MMGKRQRSELCIPEENRRRSSRLLEKKRPWSDLPEELMEVIMSNLLFMDQVCVRAVCKRWRSIRRVKPAKQIPWLLIWNKKSMALCKLHDPVYKKTYTINNTCVKDLSDSNARVWASKDGWLLISYRLCRSNDVFLLYNPFTNERFDFPAMMDRTDIHGFQTAVFSSSPISSDCIILAMEYKPYVGIILIKTCRLGETTWTTNRYKSKILFTTTNAVYISGIFYCVSICGRLGIFNVAQQTWTVTERSADDVKGFHCLVQHGGELLLVSHQIKRCGPNLCFNAFFRLDISQMRWVKLDSLGDLVIFSVGETNLVSSSATNKEIGNRIYYTLYTENNKVKFYSLESGRTRFDGRIYGNITTKHCTTPRKHGYSKFTYIEPPSD